MAFCETVALPMMKPLSDEDAQEILEAGMKVLEPTLKANLKRAIKGVSEAKMAEIKKAKLVNNIYTKFEKDHNPRSMVITFRGKVKRANVKKGGSTFERRNEIAAVLEFGKQGQPPTHFMRDALNSKKNEIDKAIQNKFNEIINK